MTSLHCGQIGSEVLLDVAGRDGSDVLEVLRSRGRAHDRERYDDHWPVGDRAQVRSRVRAVPVRLRCRLFAADLHHPRLR
jgi:hypothetical protein